ncbi:ABC transporter permease [Rhodococcus sp. 1R11]|uniref:ABC transporter permease n=1 Tax=Rhodococcus sp. 1R11 TaxID=2559614 RepID=UPI001430CB71|nr:ABC transporter permease [Rhodococcus sp. 1R11]
MSNTATLPRTDGAKSAGNHSSIDNPKKRWRLTPERVFVVVTPLTLLLIWEILARFPGSGPVMDPRIFSMPSEVAKLGWQQITTPLVGGCEISGVTIPNTILGCDTMVTLWRFVVGMVVGCVPGLLLGLTMGLFRWPRVIMGPLVSLLYPLPRVALFPLVLLVIGLNESSNIIMIALGPFFTMLIGTQAAVQNVDPIYMKVAKSYNVRTLKLYRRVLLPASMPIIFSAFRLSVGLGLLGVITVEFLIGSNGLGYMIWNAWQVLNLGLSMVGLVVTGLIGFFVFLFLDWIEPKVVPWAPAERNAQ